MDTVEQELTQTAFLKLQKGEPMSTFDFKRIMNVLQNVPINIEMPDQGEIVGLQGQFKALLQKRFLS